MSDNSTSKEVLDQLANTSSSTGGTNLITYFVPALSDMKLVTSHFTTEMSSAQNIKDKHVRDGVKSAIKSIMQLLKSYKKTLAPTNGLVLLGGEIKSYI